MQAAAIPSARDARRRLVALIGAVVLLDTAFYAVIAPLLPALAHQLRLGEAGAGLLAGSYPLGTLLGSLPGGVLAARLGPRAAVVAGLALFAASTTAFAFLDSASGLDAARFVEGIGGACSWAGGIAWVAREAAPQERGALIGRVLAAAIAGALLGPVIGTLASAVGRPAAFAGVGVLALALIAVTRAFPLRLEPTEQGLADAAGALRHRGVPLGMWLVALPAIASGLLTVMSPLRLHAFGAGAASIGAVFLGAAAAEAAVSPLIGALSDRRGRFVPMRGGLLATAALLLAFTLPDSAAVLGLVVVAIDACLGAFWAPAMALLSDVAEGHRLDQGLAAALMNLAWAAGQTLGSTAGGALASAAGDGATAAAVAALCLGTLALTLRRRSPPR